MRCFLRFIICFFYYFSCIASSKDLYLELLKKIIINIIYEDKSAFGTFNIKDRIFGKDWPAVAHSMIGMKRMNNLQFCCEDAIKNNIIGDFIETGAWRGGATIFMRAILKAYNINDRVVWVADSFEGLPIPNPEKYPADKGDTHYKHKELAVSLEEVMSNFSKYDLLDNQVKFLKGWFKDTLPHAPIDKLAVLRLDGDIYESTIDALVYLYPKLSIGGYCIIDDYGVIPSCKKAVHDYRSKFNINDKIIDIDGIGIFWKKS